VLLLHALRGGSVVQVPDLARRALWIDAERGAAGDMLLAALVDAGADPDRVTAAMGRISARCQDSIETDFAEVRRHGMRAMRVTVRTTETATVRGLVEVLDVVRSAGLDARAERFAMDVFVALAEAESRVHGVAVEEIHFHEVGAHDCIADIVGCAVALEGLGLLDDGVGRIVSTIAVGGGSVRTAHGVLPVPVPAVLELLAAAGATVTAGPADGELCTPTGAALLATLATGWGPMPPMTLSRVGVGAGTADPTTRANTLRAAIGRAVTTASSWIEASLYLLEATVDDLDPRVWPEVLDRAHDAGALDAWLAPVIMRHARPGHVVTALVTAASVDAVCREIVCGSGSLGIRVSPVERRSLRRSSVTIEVQGVPVQVKLGELDGRHVVVQPEFADANRAAAELCIPVRDVLERARALAREALSSAVATDELAWFPAEDEIT
jgi:uncharacterized protein (TIGR00299 family) protein